MSFIGNVLGILITLAVGYLIFKKYKPHTVLLAAGLLLLLASQLLGIKPIFPPDEGTGFILFDAFEALKNSTAKNVAAIGMIIMSAGGYAEYMNHIGAGEAMVRLCVAPLKKIGSPYLVAGVSLHHRPDLKYLYPQRGRACRAADGNYLSYFNRLRRKQAFSGIGYRHHRLLRSWSRLRRNQYRVGNLRHRYHGIFVKYQMSVAVPIILVITAVHFMIQKRADKALTAESPVQADKNSRIRSIPYLPATPCFP